MTSPERALAAVRSRRAQRRPDADPGHRRRPARAWSTWSARGCTSPDGMPFVAPWTRTPAGAGGRRRSPRTTGRSGPRSPPTTSPSTSPSARGGELVGDAGLRAAARTRSPGPRRPGRGSRSATRAAASAPGCGRPSARCSLDHLGAAEVTSARLGRQPRVAGREPQGRLPPRRPRPQGARGRARPRARGSCCARRTSSAANRSRSPAPSRCGRSSGSTQPARGRRRRAPWPASAVREVRDDLGRVQDLHPGRRSRRARRPRRGRREHLDLEDHRLLGDDPGAAATHGRRA